MTERKCSRCGRKLKPDWEFKECEKCHARTEKRFPKLRQYKARDFRIETMYSYPSWEESLKIARQHFKYRTKEQIQILREEYEFRKRQWERENREKVEKANRLFHVHQFPLINQDCIPTRIQVRKRFIDGEIETFETETYNHLNHCDDCSSFMVAVKNGDIIDSESPQTDPETEKKLREEGYCSLKEWNDNMNDWNKGFRNRDSIDEAEARRYPNLRDICPICGRVLVSGKCLVCEAENDSDPQRSIEQRDPLRDYFQQQHDAQKQPEKPRGFLDRLRERRDQN